MKVTRALSVILLACMVLTACAPKATTAGPVGTPVATIPAGSLAQANHLLICTDFPYPPQEFFDANGDPQGLDIELGNEIANRLGLKVQYVNSVFDTIIAAVTSGK
jgi:polar amino acid transport system substrate-binding protein